MLQAKAVNMFDQRLLYYQLIYNTSSRTRFTSKWSAYLLGFRFAKGRALSFDVVRLQPDLSNGQDLRP